MIITQLWYSKNKDWSTDEDEVMKENNCTNPEYVEDIIHFTSDDEFHNWINPKIEEINGGTAGKYEVAPGWRHFKSYELDILVREYENKTLYEIHKEDECIEEGELSKKDLENMTLSRWIKMFFEDNFEPFNEADEFLKENKNFDISLEIYKGITAYREDSSDFGAQNKLFKAGCLANRKLCTSAAFYNADIYEVTDCPENIEELSFALVKLRW